MASIPAAAIETKASISLLRLSAAAEKTATGAEAAKKLVRAAKAELKKARKSSKAAKKAAKQARKKFVAAQAASRPVGAARAAKPLAPKPARGAKRATAIRKPGSKGQQSAAQVAHSVISKLTAAKQSNSSSPASVADDAASPTGIVDATTKD